MRILVTGSSGGVGRAVSSVLKEMVPTATIVGWDIQPDDSSGVTTSLVDHRDCAAVADAAAALGPIDLLICCAGQSLEEEKGQGNELPDPEVFSRSLATNLTGPYNVVRSVSPAMPDGGSIVLVSSINALRSFGLTPYSAAKSGLHGLVLALTQPLGKRQIRINAVALGTVDTDMNREEWADFAGHRERMSALSVTGQILTPREAATSISSVALLMPGTTGQVIVVDNGQSVATPHVS